MTFEEYKEEILNGERVEWYGEMVPSKLLTPRVHAIANMVVESLNKMESEMDGMHGNSKTKEKRQRYIDDRWHHIRTLPYHSNGLIHDAYMYKYKRIMEEEEKKKGKTKPKTRKPRTKKADVKPKVKEPTKKVETKPKVDETKKEEPTPTVVKGRRGKNSKLIFGK